MQYTLDRPRSLNTEGFIIMGESERMKQEARTSDGEKELNPLA